MIQIQRYKEWLIETVAAVNAVSDLTVSGRAIAGVKIAVNEGHMIKKLRDSEGVWLCANYPDATLSGDYDSSQEQNKLLLFLVEKVASGQQDDETEILHYAKMQQLMARVKEQLLITGAKCIDLRADDAMRTEWEYDIFGGFNGLSLGLNVIDHDRTDY